MHRTAASRTLYPLLCSIINHNSPPLITANHSEYDQFCTLDVVQNSENEAESSGKEICSMESEKSVENVRRGEWTNWRGTSGQTGGAPRSALAAT